jgi:hypothetical protein
MLWLIGALIVSFAVCLACLAYVLGFNQGLSFTTSTRPTPGMPLIRAFGKKEKRKPKFVSEEEQWKREQRLPPADPA